MFWCISAEILQGKTIKAISGYLLCFINSTFVKLKSFYLGIFFGVCGGGGGGIAFCGLTLE